MCVEFVLKCTALRSIVVKLVLGIHICSYTYDRLYSGIVLGHESSHTCTFSRNIWAFSSVHTCILIINVCARASTVICERASASILSCASAYMCVRAQASTRIHTRALLSIHDYDGCSAYLSVVLSNKLLWGDLDHGYRTAHVYIQGDIGNSVYHSPEFRENSPCSGLVKKYA